MIMVKAESGVNMEMNKDKIKLDFAIGENICLVNKKYNIVRNPKNAFAIEWMIRGEEALKDILCRIGLRHNGLGTQLRESLKSNFEKIKRMSEVINKDKKKQSILTKEKPLKDKDIEITIKWVRGKFGPRNIFPSVNIVIPFTECTKRGRKYYCELTHDETIEIAYRTLCLISASDLSKSKGLETAEGILGKIL